MKALLVMVCILLASTLFIPTFTIARHLGEKDINDPPVFTTATAGEHNEPRNCGRGKSYKYCGPGTPSMNSPCFYSHNC
ncbi:hypothetical protein ERO13_D01G055200v2 [Gossypium hirsutum]|uniref:Uncharacterized protein n=4 Tax=Gossypium TaxID=3633 RepID=A0A5J5SKR2_GOSBA|nr:hypothetical protein ES319_D01G068700v1 [Gossypium barbadense]KAG4161443.1 hypothetical protein ERO13_D01G055200v2 [Gossypium hirsutum]TYG82298.1 hypothetical protein ES288_D01G076800v1 [Gossypium darwinii]TYH86862.1 hypothetical protein ES332_D01G074200v1 [Gossypium tomentosum]TYI96454.1 hypothetical protein E1A91_D01G074100v1 [Gossypium mustelinum]